MSTTEKPKVWAHRGASAYAPENTMPAFLLALQQEADGIELDVQMTKDKRLVVIHDERVDRTSDGTGFVRDMTFAELSALNFNKNFPKYGRVEIPTLEEVLDLIQKSDLMLNIELKNGIFEYPGLEEHVKKYVTYKGVQDQVIISSFNHYSLRTVGEIWQEIPRGLLYSDRWIDVPDYAKNLGLNALHPAYYHLSDGTLVEEAHKRGLKVHVWTVNEKADMERCKALSVDAIITNDPKLAREVVDAEADS